MSEPGININSSSDREKGKNLLPLKAKKAYRKKGKSRSVISISLEQRHIKWLETQENSSKAVQRLIDEQMKIDELYSPVEIIYEGSKTIKAMEKTLKELDKFQTKYLVSRIDGKLTLEGGIDEDTYRKTEAEYSRKVRALEAKLTKLRDKLHEIKYPVPKDWVDWISE